MCRACPPNPNPRRWLSTCDCIVNVQGILDPSLQPLSVEPMVRQPRNQLIETPSIASDASIDLGLSNSKSVGSWAPPHDSLAFVEALQSNLQKLSVSPRRHSLIERCHVLALLLIIWSGVGFRV